MFRISAYIIAVLAAVILMVSAAYLWESNKNESLLLENKNAKIEARVVIKNIESADITDDLVQLKKERQLNLERTGRKNEELNLSDGNHSITIGK